ncbi:c-type cytochrome [Thalassobius sp. MITS945101]|uniref:c-type cytochrome n=1 Tax=Thalassobius sp. MITS945101 TaxID=3096994 RepID=UPI0039999556
MTCKSLLLAAPVTLIVSACVAPQDTAMPEPGEGAALYQQNCAVCHGADGKGGADLAGPANSPADLTLLAQGNGGVFPRAAVLSTIDGYNRMALGDQRMPEFGGFLEGGTVPMDVGDGRMTPVPRPLAALVTYLETLQAE